jgi:plastocyanin
MNSGLRAARAILAFGAAGWLVMAPAHAATKNVSAGAANTFAPASITVRPGDTVVWTNTGGFGHTVTSSSGNWSKNDSIPVQTTTTSYLFDKAGTYRYFCSTHGTATSGMRGTVVVAGTKPRPSKTPTKTPSSRPSATTAPPPPPSSTPPSTSSTPEPSGSAGSATPPVGSATPPPSASTSPIPLPTVVPGQPFESQFLGVGGLTPPPPSGRGRGLPLLIALVLVGGVGSAELRAVLASAPE